MIIKQRITRLTILLGLVLSTHCFAEEETPVPHSTLPNENPEITLTKFCYGSCNKQNMNQDHWPVITSNNPQFWLWLGDNIYGDSEDMAVLKKKYTRLGNEMGYVELKKTCPVLAIWDDHDYGKNDAGNDFVMRKESQEVFLNFFNERKDSARWKRPGIYTSYYFGKGDKRVQLILLDTRYFRTPLKSTENKPPYRPMGKYIIDSSSDAKMLGDAQWQWLEQELKKPAKIRLIGTSIQFSAPTNGFETWTNMPAERQRMIDLIKSTKAEGVVFLSGDIHGAEMGIEEPKNGYPLIDFTSSSLNLPLGGAKTRRRIGPAYGGRNFGLVEIDWGKEDPVIRLSIRDMKNQTRLQHRIPLSKLTFSDDNVLLRHRPSSFTGEWQTIFGVLKITNNAPKPSKSPEPIDYGTWSATCGDRNLDLKLTGGELAGTWQGKNSRGKVRFRLTRDGQFLYGEYSDGDLPLQLDWAGWKSDWEKHFTRDDYHQRKKKK
ncbi:MAG: alkaline phosphatase D family protein [Akkermansiaceae bacterium]